MDEHTRLADLSAPFFAGCSRGELLIPQCRRCRRFFFYPTVLCPHCHYLGFDWYRAAGRATLYSYTVVHRPLSSALRGRVPYVVGIVDLAEGVRMMTNIVDCPTDVVAIGMPLEVRFDTSWDGRPIPVFRPAAGLGQAVDRG